ncbi:hypothetical protein [Vibrio cholerae]|uniref:hypothetical protein n=1 Tax=Vibrio cholerae TaxID=666 RepID=UPI000E0AE6A9|nr:hypothetical protein [Vibrio cholerae]
MFEVQEEVKRSFLIINDVQFDVSNIRQTALHVIKTGACHLSLNQEQVEESLKEFALLKIKKGEHELNQLINVSGMQAYFVVEDFGKKVESDTHRYEVNFFVRVGHRQER